ncbi:MAG: hypothetical protein JSV19_09995 [Phycisphaerales bacterium]|nr:MAG: hypothetical protein JSV19_09995 [Phycisphaerales bacterium]
MAPPLPFSSHCGTGTLDVHAIINPVSGRRDPARAIARVRQGLAREGVGVTCTATREPGDATCLARNVPDSARAILIVGGDGTVREVVTGRVGRPTPLLVLGTGTENIVAKALGMPRDPDHIVERILHGMPRPTDVGVVNGRKFLIISGIGFDAEVVHRLHRARAGHISYLDYFWPIWRTFWGHVFPELHVETDGRALFDGNGLVFVGVLRRYSLGLQILSKARHDDGLLDVCVYPCASRARLMGHAARTLLGRHTSSRETLYAQCRTATVHSNKPVSMQVDGDVGGSLPATYSVIPSGIWFLMAPS